MGRKVAGLIYGPEVHQIDHLAPLCLILGIPLVVSDEEVAAAGSKYYPGLELIYWDYLHLAHDFVKSFDVAIYSMPRALFDEVFFFAEKMGDKLMHTVWCPHGNSDKGNRSFYIEALAQEEMALVYGQQMIDFLKRKGSYNQLKECIELGNYRYNYFRKHREREGEMAEREVFRRLPQAKKTFLYAPTWQDYEKSSSFFEAMPHLGERLPPDTNLIVKIHPNLLLQTPEGVEEIKEPFIGNPHILFLDRFSPIYPLLERTDLYIGDMSSIGYDYLAFDRPMCFLNQNRRDPESDRGLYLSRCGLLIEPQQYGEIYQLIEHELRDFSTIRKQVYHEAFGPDKELSYLKNEILRAIDAL